MFNRTTATKLFAPRRKDLLTADLRRLSQMKNESPQRRRGRREFPFLFVGRRRQTKTYLHLGKILLPNRRLPIGQKFFPLRTWLSLRLIRPLAESLRCNVRILICENRRKSAVNILMKKEFQAIIAARAVVWTVS